MQIWRARFPQMHWFHVEDMIHETIRKITCCFSNMFCKIWSFWLRWHNCLTAPGAVQLQKQKVTKKKNNSLVRGSERGANVHAGCVHAYAITCINNINVVVNCWCLKVIAKSNDLMINGACLFPPSSPQGDNFRTGAIWARLNTITARTSSCLPSIVSSTGSNRSGRLRACHVRRNSGKDWCHCVLSSNLKLVSNIAIHLKRKASTVCG